MKLMLFSILDQKAGIFLAPFVSRSTADAERQITQSLRDPAMLQTPVGQNPEDFVLYTVGYFDDEIGTIEALSAPRLITPVLALRGTVSS